MAERILIIDDRPEVARAMARALRDYETSTETDPRCAVRRVADGERFDLVLCDFDMPEMTGGEVYDAFQQTVGAAPVMLMMSGEANVASLYATGCPVLIKPVSPTELRTLVSNILHDPHG